MGPEIYSSPNTKRNRLLAIAIGISVLLLIAAGIAILYPRWNGTGEVTPSAMTPQAAERFQNVRESLAQNPSYVAAIAAMQQSQYQTAYNLFTEALSKTSTDEERGQLEYNQALALLANSQPLKAVPVLKGIADNESYSRLLRSYALERIVSLYITYRYKGISDALFSTEPYKNFITSNPLLSYRKVAEYAADSLYPIAEAELDVAAWYANDAYAAYTGTASTSVAAKARITTDAQSALLRLSLAQKDIPRIASDPVWAAGLPETYFHLADTAATLRAVGIPESEAGNPEKLYQQGFAALNTNAGFSGFTLLYQAIGYYDYAAYLARTYGVSRASDIKSLLAHFYTSTTYQIPPITNFFASAAVRTNNTHATLVKLAGIDPDFKKYLVSLGWKF